MRLNGVRNKRGEPMCLHCKVKKLVFNHIKDTIEEGESGAEEACKTALINVMRVLADIVLTAPDATTKQRIEEFIVNSWPQILSETKKNEATHDEVGVPRMSEQDIKNIVQAIEASLPEGMKITDAKVVEIKDKTSEVSPPPRSKLH